MATAWLSFLIHRLFIKGVHFPIVFALGIAYWRRAYVKCAAYTANYHSLLNHTTRSHHVATLAGQSYVYRRQTLAAIAGIAAIAALLPFYHPINRQVPIAGRDISRLMNVLASKSKDYRVYAHCRPLIFRASLIPDKHSSVCFYTPR